MREVGTPEQEKERYEAMQYSLKSLVLEYEIKRLEAKVDYYRYPRTRWKRFWASVSHKRLLAQSKRTAKKLAA